MNSKVGRRPITTRFESVSALWTENVKFCICLFCRSTHNCPMFYQLAGTGPSGPRYSYKVPLQDVKRWIACTVLTAWATEWSHATLPFIRKIKGDIGKWTDLANLRDQRIFSRLRTGHAIISRDFSGGPFRKICDICHIPSTVEHVLCVCPQYEHLRCLHGLPASIRDMLGDVPSTQAAVLRFLKAAELYFRI